MAAFHLELAGNFYGNWRWQDCPGVWICMMTRTASDELQMTFYQLASEFYDGLGINHNSLTHLNALVPDLCLWAMIEFHACSLSRAQSLINWNAIEPFQLGFWYWHVENQSRVDHAFIILSWRFVRWDVIITNYQKIFKILIWLLGWAGLVS